MKRVKTQLYRVHVEYIDRLGREAFSSLVITPEDINQRIAEGQKVTIIKKVR